MTRPAARGATVGYNVFAACFFALLGVSSLVLSGSRGSSLPLWVAVAWLVLAALHAVKALRLVRQQRR